MQKFDHITDSYSQMLKYVSAGWKLVSSRKVFLNGINKEYTEYCLKWEKDDSPIIPELL